jgi:hypothetical protein
MLGICQCAPALATHCQCTQKNARIGCQHCQCTPTHSPHQPDLAHRALGRPCLCPSTRSASHIQHLASLVHTCQHSLFFALSLLLWAAHSRLPRHTALPPQSLASHDMSPWLGCSFSQSHTACTIPAPLLVVLTCIHAHCASGAQCNGHGWDTAPPGDSSRATRRGAHPAPPGRRPVRQGKDTTVGLCERAVATRLAPTLLARFVCLWSRSARLLKHTCTCTHTRAHTHTHTHTHTHNLACALSHQDSAGRTAVELGKAHPTAADKLLAAFTTMFLQHISQSDIDKTRQMLSAGVDVCAALISRLASPRLASPRLATTSSPTSSSGASR